MKTLVIHFYLKDLSDDPCINLNLASHFIIYTVEQQQSIAWSALLVDIETTGYQIQIPLRNLIPLMVPHK